MVTGTDVGLISLDDPLATDVAVVGAKAALLASARAMGMPALPGIVIPTAAARRALAAARALASERGAPAARRAAYETDLDGLLEPDAAGIRDLGQRLVVRSSSPLEGDGRWSGVFTSYVDVALDELGAAIRGVWASVWSPTACELAALTGRDPVEASIAVLVQPYADLEWGGTARLDDRRVLVRGTRSGLPALLAGATTGLAAVVDADGEPQGDLPAELARAVASLVHPATAIAARPELEWGRARDGRLHLLQLRQGSAPAPGSLGYRPTRNRAGPALARLARLVADPPGCLRETLVLPWAVAAPPRPVGRPAVMPGEAVPALAGAILDLAASVTAAAWQMAPTAAVARAEELFDGLAAGNASEAGILDRLARPDPARCAQLLDLVAALGRSLAAEGRLATPQEIWDLDADALRALAGGSGRRLRTRPRRSWEPCLDVAAWSCGRIVRSVAAAPGRRAARAMWTALPPDGPSAAGRVLVARSPHPVLAPLLWPSVALVTVTGDPAAHLVGIARSLGVPAVTGCEVDPMPDGTIVAVDGDEGAVAILEPESHA